MREPAAELECRVDAEVKNLGMINIFSDKHILMVKIILEVTVLLLLAASSWFLNQKPSQYLDATTRTAKLQLKYVLGAYSGPQATQTQVRSPGSSAKHT